MDLTEIVVDNFAGGGGASTGIEAALGRSIDVAINHDPEAVAVHRANHPGTHHYCQSVWRADPQEVTKGRPVGLAWFSPDCKHFSKAKGGTPVEKNIRDLAWVVVLWAKRVRPRVIMLENVEEFQTWGPLTEEGYPCPDRKGQTFKHWKRELRRYGYKLEMRELRACDYGGDLLDAAPTIRNRLFIIARCDGLPIVWPERTHGPADHPDVISGKLKPWRVAANIIDFSIPCPSIFDDSATIKKLYGVRAIRPLADATMARIARGVFRYVIDPARRYIVPASAGLQAASMVQTGYGERPGQKPRSLDIEAPVGTQVAGGGKHAVVAAFLAQHNTGVVGHAAEEPVSTLTSKPGPHGLISVHMTYAQQGGANRPAKAPLHTLTASSKDQNGMVAAHLVAVNHGDSGGRREYDVTNPTMTQTAKRGEALVATHLQTLRGSNRRDAATDAPLNTQSAGGNHSALVAAFLTKYYTTGATGHGANEPFHTMRTKDGVGLVTVTIDGQDYALTDIGMRMLTPRERFLAQGFPADYIIDHGIDENGKRMKISLDAQGRLCGNSVCPPLAEALVRCNLVDQVEQREAA